MQQQLSPPPKPPPSPQQQQRIRIIQIKQQQSLFAPPFAKNPFIICTSLFCGKTFPYVPYANFFICVIMINRVLKEYTFLMNKVKRLIGIVSGLFFTFLVAWLCSHFFRLDADWYFALKKPVPVPDSIVFTVLVVLTYVSSVLVISQLVTGKHIFPSMLFFLGKGISVFLYVYVFFTLKNIIGGMVFMTFTFAFSFILFIRFCKKDIKTALAYLYTFVFNFYAFVVMIAITMAN